ncbi:restriction endonuclease subunit S [Endozoicomonas sp. ALB115]|uniref:restriction endonuclease subunit S n=1 Tax=Endozoicomonas sp. ALB115 TaxID=3403074 RepID=UPI003BB719F6
MSLVIAPIKDFAHGIYDGPHATPKEATEGHIFLGIKNVTPEGRLDFSQIKYVSEEEFPKWTKRVTPQAGDVVFSYEATLHRYAVIPGGFDGCLGRRMGLVRPDTTKLLPRYLHYYFLSPVWQRYLETKVITGVTVNRLPIKDFPDFLITVPSIDEQARIVDVLSSYDDLIENNHRRIQLLEESTRLLYQEWFVHLRFPGHEHVKVVDGIPEGWEPTKLPDIIEVNPKTKVEKQQEIWYVPMSALSESAMTADKKDFERRTKHTNVKFIKNDTLLARITPCLENGKTGFAYFLKDDEIACGSTEFIVLRGKRVSPEFTYCLARSYPFRENAIKSMTGSSGRQRVQITCFNEYSVPLAPESILCEFDQFVAENFWQIRNLMDQNARLEKARDLLLPRLMNGELTP